MRGVQGGRDPARPGLRREGGGIESSEMTTGFPMAIRIGGERLGKPNKENSCKKKQFISGGKISRLPDGEGRSRKGSKGGKKLLLQA